MRHPGETAFAALGAAHVDLTTKGFPPLSPPTRLDEIGRQGWSLLRGDLPFPVAILSQRALRTNSHWMRAFIEANGLKLAPHGKTTMAPQLFRLQQEDGAWAITVATVQQLAVCRRFGFDRVLIANEPVGAEEIDYLFAELDAAPGLQILCLVDSEAGVERLAEAGRSAGNLSRLGILLEVGVLGGRAGCRDLGSAMAVARKAVALGLSLQGVEGFEGILATSEQVDHFLDFLCSVAGECAREGLFAEGQPVILSAGGSVFYDRVAAKLAAQELGRPVEVVVRSGCYLTHDSVIIEQAYRSIRARGDANLPPGDPEPALTVWTHVQSRPEPDRAILAVGRRDISFDAGLPVPLLWFSPARHSAPVAMPPDHAVTALNDQHCYLQCPQDSAIGVGDVVAFGISHPCTTFDKWQLVYVVNDRWEVVDAIRTFF